MRDSTFGRLFSTICFAVLLLAVSAGSAQAAAYVFDGPQDETGATCVPAAPGCILGDPLLFHAYRATLTSPDSPGGMWKLEFETNYGVNLDGVTDVPAYSYAGALLAMCDFLIDYQGIQYGIVLSSRGGYTAGNLYESPGGFLTSGEVLTAAGIASQRPDLPVQIAPGGSLVGTGSLLGQATGADGSTDPQYRVTVNFNAPSTFLNEGGFFTVHACSWACANGYITGEADVLTSGELEITPEPGTWSLMGMGLVILGLAKSRFSTSRNR